MTAKYRPGFMGPGLEEAAKVAAVIALLGSVSLGLLLLFPNLSLWLLDEGRRLQGGHSEP